MTRLLDLPLDATARYATQRGEGSGMGVEQHFVALRRVRLNDERLAVTELEVRHRQL